LQKRVLLFSVDGLELGQGCDEFDRQQRPVLQLQDPPLGQRRVDGCPDVTLA